jgi:RNA polymerase sigma-70 factor (ECF subfamily)
MGVDTTLNQLQVPSTALRVRALAGELDGEALVRCRRRDALATRALVATYQDRVYALVWRMLGGSHRVDDVAQETFLRVFAHLDRFDPKGPARLSTWVLTIATRLCLDELRKHKVRGTAVELDAQREQARELPTDATRVDDRVAAHLDNARVKAALQTLPADQRAALVLRVFHELSVDETARILGVEEGTVKSRVSRA